MLKGRESLIRVVGRRRRFLPNRQYLLSSHVQSSGNLDKEDGNEETKSVGVEEETSTSTSISSSGWVTCPVCGNRVSGGEYMINSHLDVCLARGRKRKLIQRTLLQLNFCSKSNGLNIISADDNLAKQAFHESPGIPTCNVNNHEESSTCINNLVDNKIGDATVENDVDNRGLGPTNCIPEFDLDVSMDDMREAVLETFIVGRRFSNEKEIKNGLCVSFERDPHNAKDPNAIKVISADLEGSKVLGFLPRELALYLSPLIDNYCFCFEGFVTALPEHPLGVVPIRVVCQGIQGGYLDCEDLQVLKSLWKNALAAVKRALESPPSRPKYQHNFLMLIAEVLQSYSYLFTPEERIFLESFKSLSDDGQRLFIRLYMRKGPWFRVSNISYKEITDSHQAIKGLSESGYVCSLDSDDNIQRDNLEAVLNVLTNIELRDILNKLKKKCDCGTRKQDVIGLLLAAKGDGLCPSLSSLVMDKLGSCVQISPAAELLIWRAQRLFFLNGEQDLSAFLLVDLGIVKYPAYNCIISDRIFSSRCELLAYEKAVEVAQIMDQALDESNTEVVLKCIEISDSRMLSPCRGQNESESLEPLAAAFLFFSASWVNSKIVQLGVSFLEREHRYGDAIRLLKRLLLGFDCDGRRGYWTLRLSVDLEHVGCLNESLLVAEGGLSDSWVRAGSRIALQRRVLRLGKPPRRWKTPSFSESVNRKIPEVFVQGRPLNFKAGTKSRFYGEDGEQCGVEELALQYYAGEGGGWQGVHTESGIWLTIFALLMWDIIFADVPNVFRTRFQIAPLDLDTDSFYMVRKNLIESHLQRIHDGLAEEILIKSWELNNGTSCRGVNWERHSLSELRAAIACIGGSCLASICRHLAQDYRSWSSGMPDLLLWRFNEDFRGEAKLVEVKGPRDRLSEQQRAWLLVLMDCGFSVEVCKGKREFVVVD
ncbi:HIRAN domain [Dillenia turbinata]|uniref:Fanconi-associated nuclease n=1 Tax=Dillenia turbinata TaxID=194707 RepID=A0AAN8V6I6_9MAGN